MHSRKLVFSAPRSQDAPFSLDMHMITLRHGVEGQRQAPTGSQGATSGARCQRRKGVAMSIQHARRFARAVLLVLCGRLSDDCPRRHAHLRRAGSHRAGASATPRGSDRSCPRQPHRRGRPPSRAFSRQRTRLRPQTHALIPVGGERPHSVSDAGGPESLGELVRSNRFWRIVHRDRRRLGTCPRSSLRRVTNTPPPGSGSTGWRNRHSIETGTAQDSGPVARYYAWVEFLPGSRAGNRELIWTCPGRRPAI